MQFFVFCAGLAFVLQLGVLAIAERKLWRWLSLALMEVPPAAAVLYYAIKRPASFFFDWKDNVFFGVLMMLSVLAGYALAWLIWKLLEKQ